MGVCFNPYFIGLCITTVKETEFETSMMSFNPYCIGLCITTIIIEVNQPNQLCFNPYCIGLCITTLNIINVIMITEPFQSLLYWIMYYYIV